MTNLVGKPNTGTEMFLIEKSEGGERERLRQCACERFVYRSVEEKIGSVTDTWYCARSISFVPDSNRKRTPMCFAPGPSPNPSLLLRSVTEISLLFFSLFLQGFLLSAIQLVSSLLLSSLLLPFFPRLLRHPLDTPARGTTAVGRG